MAEHRIFGMPFASVYPAYVNKAERKGRTKAEVDELIAWLTGYSGETLDRVIADKADLKTFFAKAPALNPARADIKGIICGVRIESIEEPTMREIRRLDKVIDELAKGRPIDRIKRDSN